MAQGHLLGRLGYQDLRPDDSVPIINAAEPPAKLNGWIQNCQCGPECSCVFCPTHPYNDATRQRIQELDGIVKDDDDLYTDLDPQQSGDVAAYTNNTSIVPEMAQGFLTPDPDFYLPNWMSMPNQDSALDWAFPNGTDATGLPN